MRSFLEVKINKRDFGSFHQQTLTRNDLIGEWENNFELNNFIEEVLKKDIQEYIEVYLHKKEIIYILENFTEDSTRKSFLLALSILQNNPWAKIIYRIIKGV